MLGDFFGHPVTIDALWCEDQGEVNLPGEEQHTYVIDKNLGLACSHLHEVAELFLVASMIQCHLLVVEWFIFKIVATSPQKHDGNKNEDMIFFNQISDYCSALEIKFRCRNHFHSWENDLKNIGASVIKVDVFDQRLLELLNSR